MEAMGLVKPDKSLREQEKMQVEQQKVEEEVPVLTLSKEKVLEEIRAKEKEEKPVLSLVVVGASASSSLFPLPSAQIDKFVSQVTSTLESRR
jgi:hypothetical protein